MHKSFGGLCKFSSTPHDEGAGRGPRRGATPKTPSSPRPPPPSDGGEGVSLVAALTRQDRRGRLALKRFPRRQLQSRPRSAILSETRQILMNQDLQRIY